MSDNKTKRGFPDNKLLNVHEPYEVQYAIGKLAAEFPNVTHAQIKKALLESAQVENFHHNRDMILNSSRLKLKNL
jgi:hypothetical protein